MFGTFTGAAVDAGNTAGEFMVTSDSVRLSVRWDRLANVDNRALMDARTDLEQRGAYDPAVSANFSEWYVLALFLSDPIQKWLLANKRSMKDHVYPHDLRGIPVKTLTSKQQKPFVDLAKERHTLLGELHALESQGYLRGKDIELPVRALVEEYFASHPKQKHLSLLQAQAKGLLSIEPALKNVDLRKVRASGDEVLLRKEVVVRLGPSIKDREPVASLLAGIVQGLPGTLGDHEGSEQIPADEAGLQDLAEFVENRRAEVRAKADRVNHINLTLDEMAWKLYRPE
jgi:hypothetical protein